MWSHWLVLCDLPSCNTYCHTRGVSLNGCSSKAQPLLLTLDEGYCLMAAPPDLGHGVAPIGLPAQPPLLGRRVAPPGRRPDLRLVVAPLGRCPWPWTEDRNGMDLTEAEDIKMRWQEYTEELYKKEVHSPDDHDGVITHLEPECQVVLRKHHYEQN